MAFRVLRDVYGVKDFGAAQIKLSIPKPALPIPEGVVPLPIQTPAQSVAEKPYVVFVDDNYHYMDEEERYKSGDYETLEEAVVKCKIIVDEFLEREHKSGMSPNELYDRYCMFGEDPFIRGPTAEFSARDYARLRCDALCRNMK
jgi:hypothetical protein